MVAKLDHGIEKQMDSLNLAKIHMVAKRGAETDVNHRGLNLAKIHMVAKQYHLQY